MIFRDQPSSMAVSQHGNIGKFRLYVNYFYPRTKTGAGDNGEWLFFMLPAPAEIAVYI